MYRAFFTSPDLLFVVQLHNVGTFFCNHLFLQVLTIIYHEGNISKMPYFDGFFLLFWNVKSVKVDLVVNETMAALSAKYVLKNA